MYRRELAFIGACFYNSGLVKLVRWWTQHSGQHLIILNYHRAAGGDLRSHLLYLRRHYRILHLEVALDELYKERKKGKQIRDWRTPLVLTFDDGYRDNYTYAFALAQELQVPITFFLIPSYIERRNHFWWLEGDHLVNHAQVGEATIEGRIYHLDRQEDCKALAQTIDARVRYASSVAEREAFLTSVRAILQVPSSVVPEDDPALPFTWAEVREMNQCEWISFGAHTMHHPVLACLTDPAEVQREVRECRTMLEQELEHPVRTFAYPLGLLEHIGDYGFRAVQEAGYDWAVTTIEGFNTPQTDPYLLRRIKIDITQHWMVMAAATSGVWQFFSRLRRIPKIYLIRKRLTRILQR